VGSIRQLAGQTALYGFSSIVGRLLNYLLVPFYTRIFSAEEYGIVSELFAWAGFLAVIYTYGMETAFFHFSGKTGSTSKVFNTGVTCLLLSSVLFSTLLVVFSGPLARTLRYSDHPEYLIWFALIILFDTLSALPFARLRKENKVLAFVIIRLSGIFINIFFNIFFLWLCPLWIQQEGFFHWLASRLYSPEIGVGYVFLSNLLASVSTFTLLLPQFRGWKPDIDSALLRDMWWYGLPLLVAGLAGMVNETLDRAIYKFLAPEPATAMHELGIYSACYKLSIIMTLFIQTFRYAADPFFFSHRDKEGSRELFARVMNYFVITCSFIFTAVMLFMDLFKHFIGKEFHSGLHVVPILLMANLCLGIYYNLSIWYKLTGQTRYGAYFSIAGAVITIVLLFLLIPAMGYRGAAWTTLICYASMMLMSYFTGRKHYPIPYDIKKMIFYPLTGLMFYFAMEGAVILLQPALSVKLMIAVFLTSMFVALVWMMEKK
jgi:O-antigen/teichoic acid export membrane protein